MTEDSGHLLFFVEIMQIFEIFSNQWEYLQTGIKEIR